MQRFTISLTEDLARQFDAFIESRGYENRSEAVRDLIRDRLGDRALVEASPADAGQWCVATVCYVYDHHEQSVTLRLLDMQHDHHDLVVGSHHHHLDHHDCMETVVLRGPLAPVAALAARLVALRGVRHGNIHLIPLGGEGGDGHRHPHGGGSGEPHVHMKPLN